MDTFSLLSTHLKKLTWFPTEDGIPTGSCYCVYICKYLNYMCCHNENPYTTLPFHMEWENVLAVDFLDFLYVLVPGGNRLVSMEEESNHVFGFPSNGCKDLS